MRLEGDRESQRVRKGINYIQGIRTEEIKRKNREKREEELKKRQ